MFSPDWNDDDVLMAELSGAVQAGWAEQEADRLVTAAAQGVFAWQSAFTDLEAELLELTSDSLFDRELSVRDLGGADGPRILTFEAGESGVELEIGERGIVGQILPPAPGRVELFSAAGSLGSVTADEVGCFAFGAEGAGPLGPVRVRIDANGRRLVTDWVTVRVGPTSSQP
jgi:hypothetical protein